MEATAAHTVVAMAPVILNLENFDEFRDQLSLQHADVMSFDFVALKANFSRFPEFGDTLNGQLRFSTEGEGRALKLSEAGHKKFMEVTEKVQEKREAEVKEQAKCKTEILKKISRPALDEIIKTIGGTQVLAQCTLAEMMTAMTKALDKAKKAVANDVIREFMDLKPDSNLTKMINKEVAIARRLKNAFEIKKDGEGTGKCYVDAIIIAHFLNLLKSEEMDFLLKKRDTFDPTKTGLSFEKLVEETVQYARENSIQTLTFKEGETEYTALVASAQPEVKQKEDGNEKTSNAPSRGPPPFAQCKVPGCTISAGNKKNHKSPHDYCYAHNLALRQSIVGGGTAAPSVNAAGGGGHAYQAIGGLSNMMPYNSYMQNPSYFTPMQGSPVMSGENFYPQVERNSDGTWTIIQSNNNK